MRQQTTTIDRHHSETTAELDVPQKGAITAAQHKAWHCPNALLQARTATGAPAAATTPNTAPAAL
jgi:hypothetical protein